MASGRIVEHLGALLYNNVTSVLTDFNISHVQTIVTIGLWNSQTANRPGNESFYGFYIHLSTSDNYAIQVAANIGHGDRLYIRNKSGGTWNAWKTFTAS